MPNLRKALSIAVLLACGSFLLFYMRNHLSDFKNISEISVPYLLLIGCASLFALIVNGLFLKALTIGFGIDLCFLEYFSISVITSFGNTFLPMKGGMGFRAVYLKARYNFDYTFFLSSLAANYLISFNVTSLVALAGLAVFYLRTGNFNLPVTAIFLSVAAATSWAILFPPTSIDWVPFRPLRERVNQVLSGWKIMKQSHRTILNLCALTALNLFLTSAMTWFEFAAFNMKDSLGNEIGFLQSLIFTAIGVLTFLVSITPAALGIKESLLMFSSQFLGIAPPQALAVSLLDRTIVVLVLALFFGFTSLYIRKQLHANTQGSLD